MPEGSVRRPLVLALTLVALVAVPRVGRTETVAVVDGQAITSDEVEQGLSAQLHKLEEQAYALRQQKLDALIAERLLAREAARRGASVQALVDAEVTSKVRVVTEQEIDAFYEANKARIRGDEANLRDRIRGYLQNQKLAAQREAFIASLRSNAKVVVYLKEPPRPTVSVEGAPSRGPAGAAVTIVEFSDFHCPFCRAVEPTIKQVLARYADKVRLVYRDFPLDNLHPGARRAAEAARCATDQGKFWPYHDLIYAKEPDGSPAELKRFAQQVGLDVDAFDACVASGKHRADVQKDVEEGVRLGVDGTPAFFINGRLLSGAQPLEAFVRVIDQELERPH